MSGYTKLFNSILDSTIWGESDGTRLVWVTLLAMSDKNGEVQSSVPGLAHRARVSLEDAEAALECLQSPDAYSRTPEHSGRRIAPIDGGWVLLNHAKYRRLLSTEERREYKAQKQKEYRSKKSTLSTCGQSGHITEADTDTKAEAPRISAPIGASPQRVGGRVPVIDEEFEENWTRVPHRIGKGAARKAWKKARKLATPDQLIDGLHRHERHRIAQKDPPSPIHPATFWNAERWEDDYGSAKPKMVNGIRLDAPAAKPIPPAPPDLIDWFRSYYVGPDGTPNRLGDEAILDRWQDADTRRDYAKRNSNPIKNHERPTHR